jgi:hypothetical protein
VLELDPAKAPDHRQLPEAPTLGTTTAARSRTVKLDNQPEAR